MYGEIRIKVGDLYVYKKIISLDYGIIGYHIPQINYPTCNCQPEELPELDIKKFVIDVEEGWDYENTYIEIINLHLSLGERCEYSIEYKVKSYEFHNDLVILEVV